MRPPHEIAEKFKAKLLAGLELLLTGKWEGRPLCPPLRLGTDQEILRGIRDLAYLAKDVEQLLHTAPPGNAEVATCLQLIKNLRKFGALFDRQAARDSHACSLSTWTYKGDECLRCGDHVTYLFRSPSINQIGCIHCGPYVPTRDTDLISYETGYERDAPPTQPWEVPRPLLDFPKTSLVGHDRWGWETRHGQGADGYVWVYQAGPDTFDLRPDQVRAVMLGTTRGLKLQGAIACPACSVRGPKDCDLCAGHRRVPVMLPHNPQDREKFTTGYPARAWVENEQIRVATLQVSAEGEAQYRTSTTPTLEQLWLSFQWLVAIDKTLEQELYTTALQPKAQPLPTAQAQAQDFNPEVLPIDLKYSALAITKLRDSSREKWLGTGGGTEEVSAGPVSRSGGVATENPNPVRVDPGKAYRALREPTGTRHAVLGPTTLLLWTLGAPRPSGSTARGFLYSATDKIEVCRVLLKSPVDPPQPRPHAGIRQAGQVPTVPVPNDLARELAAKLEDIDPGATITLSRELGRQLEEIASLQKYILSGLEKQMGIIAEQAAKEAAAMANADPGETLRSASGAFEIGDRVMVRPQFWASEEPIEGVEPRLFANAMNQLGTVVSSHNADPASPKGVQLFVVEHSTGIRQTWHPGYLKLTADHPADDLPQPEAVDYDLSDNDFAARLARARRLS